MLQLTASLRPGNGDWTLQLISGDPTQKDRFTDTVLVGSKGAMLSSYPTRILLTEGLRFWPHKATCPINNNDGDLRAISIP